MKIEETQRVSWKPPFSTRQYGIFKGYTVVDEFTGAPAGWIKVKVGNVIRPMQPRFVTFEGR